MASSSQNSKVASDWFQRVFLPKRTMPKESSAFPESTEGFSYAVANISIPSIHQISSLTPSTLCGAMKNWMRSEKVGILFLGDASRFPLLNILLWTSCVTESQYQTLQEISRKSNITPQTPSKVVYPSKDYNPSHALQTESRILQGLQKFMQTKAAEPFTFILPEENQRRANFLLTHSIVPDLHVIFKAENEMNEAERISLQSLHQFWGKSLYFRGTGKSINADRIFIHQRLFQVIQGYFGLIKKCTIGLPCHILDGNRDILDCSNVSEIPNDMDCPDLVILNLREDGLERSISDYLLSSGFIRRLIERDARLILLFHCDQFSETQSSPSLLKDYFTTCKNSCSGQLKTLLLKEYLSHHSLSFFDLSGDAVAQIEGDISLIMKNIDIFPVKPLTFACLSLNRKSYLDRNEVDIFEKLQLSTNVPSFISSLINIKLLKCRNQLRKTSQLFIEKLSEPHSTPADRILRQFSNDIEGVVGACKNALLHGLSEFSSPLLNRDFENFDLSMKDKREILDEYFEFIETVWKSTVLEPVIAKLHMIVLASQSITKDCASFSSSPTWTQLPVSERVRLRRHIEFCRVIHSHTLSRVAQIQKTLTEDISKTIESVSLECLSAHSLLLLRSHSEEGKSVDTTHTANEIDEWKAFLSSISRVLSERFSSSIVTCLDHLEWIEKNLCVSSKQVVQDLPSSQSSHDEVCGGTVVNRRNRSEGSFLSEKEEDVGRKKRNTSDGSFSKMEAKVDEKSNVLSLSKDFFTPNHSINLSLSDSVQILNPHIPLRFTSEQKRHLAESLELSGLKPIECVRDSHSQFRSVSQLIYGSEEAYGVVRLIAICEAAKYTRLVDSVREFGSKEHVQDYLSRMMKDSSRGDFYSLLCIANAYDAQIYLYTPAFEFPISFSPEKGHNISFTLCLLLDEDYYYRPLTLIRRLSNSTDEMTDVAQVIVPSFASREIVEQISFRFAQLEIETAPKSHCSSPIVFNSAVGGLATMEAGEVVPLTLVSLCVTKIAQYAHRLPDGIGGFMPEDIVRRILNCVRIQRNLSPFVLHRILDGAFLDDLDISDCRYIPDESFPVISSLCHESLVSFRMNNTAFSKLSFSQLFSANFVSFRHFEAKNCTTITNKLLITLAQACPLLESVNVSGCTRISDYGITELFLRCSSLSSLQVRDCVYINGEFVPHVSHQCYDLDFVNCPITLDRFNQLLIATGVSLRSLKVGGKSVTENFITLIPQTCPNLRQLEVLNPLSISEQAIHLLSRSLPSLQKVTLHNIDSLSDNSLSSVVWSDLTSLDISGCTSLMGSQMENLANSCGMLTNLNLSCCEGLTERALSSFLVRCQNLETIDLSRCPNVTDSVLIALSHVGSNLKSVSLGYCSQISNEGVISLVRSSPLLETLNISGAPISDDSLVAVAAYCPSLRSLSVEDTHITDKGLNHISQSCSVLQHLRLAHCSEITDFSLEYLCIGCPFITKIDLSLCNSLTCRGIQQALWMWTNLSELNLRGFSRPMSDPPHHPTLRILNLSWSRHVGDHILSSLPRYCPNLEELDLSYCSNVSPQALRPLFTELRFLRVLNIRGCARISNSASFDMRSVNVLR